jgi:hypothetical protein
MTFATFHSTGTTQRGPGLEKIWRQLYFPHCRTHPTLKRAIFNLFLGCYDAHPSRRIRQFPPAIETANVIKSAPIAVRPRYVTMDAAKHVRQNPSDPLHGDTFAEVCCAVRFVNFRVWDRSDRRINCLSFLRARAACAFRVPSGTPRIRAASRIDKPSISRSWNALRRVGVS